MTTAYDETPAEVEAVETEEEYPVCPDCGERHPVLSLDQQFETVLGMIAAEALKIVNAEPGKYPDLEQVVRIGQQIAQRVYLSTVLKSVLGREPTPEEIVSFEEYQQQGKPAAAPVVPQAKATPDSNVGIGLYL